MSSSNEPSGVHPTRYCRIAGSYSPSDPAGNAIGDAQAVVIDKTTLTMPPRRLLITPFPNFLAQPARINPLNSCQPIRLLDLSVSRATESPLRGCTLDTDKSRRPASRQENNGYLGACRAGFAAVDPSSCQTHKRSSPGFIAGSGGLAGCHADRPYQRTLGEACQAPARGPGKEALWDRLGELIPALAHHLVNAVHFWQGRIAHESDLACR